MRLTPSASFIASLMHKYTQEGSSVPGYPAAHGPIQVRSSEPAAVVSCAGEGVILFWNWNHQGRLLERRGLARDRSLI